MRYGLTTWLLLVQFALVACTGRGDEGSRHGKPSATRDYGYVIGDLLPMDYRFELKGDEIDPTSLPSPGPLNEWLSIRRYHIEHHPHREVDETRLHVEYQIFKGIKSPELLTLPSLTFRLRTHPETALTTEPWSFTLVPVIPPDLTNEEIEPQEGLSVGEIDTRAPSQRLAYWFSGGLTTLLLMMLRRYLQQRRYRPFQSSQGRIRAAFREGADPQILMEGMRLMHRAFDHTYGQTLFRRDIPAFLIAPPSYQKTETALQAFFTVSGQIFFTSEPLSLESKDLRQLIELLSQCVQAERAQL